MRNLVATLTLFLAVNLAGAREPSQTTHADSAPQQHAVPAGVSAEDAQALREEVARMKSLVNQMDRNLANVSFSQDALKHQFQLEIEMWRLQIASMERRLEPADR